MRAPWFYIVTLAICFVFACSNGSGNKSEYEEIACDISNENLDISRDELGLENSIAIKFENGSASIDNPYENEVVTLIDGENIIAQNLSTGAKYNLVLSGNAQNGSLKIYGEREIGLYLNGVSIANQNGPAINIQGRQKTSVHLVCGTKNTLTDGGNYEKEGIEKAKGAFYSRGLLHFLGGGNLEINGEYAHALVIDNALEIENGNITVNKAAKDGIHADEGIHVKGGNIKITSSNEGIQSENSLVNITGGKIDIQTKGTKAHGISSADSTIISESAIVQISVSGNASKGIRSSGFIAIKGGNIDIKTSGNRSVDNSAVPPDTSTAAGIRADSDLEISGGILKIKSIGENSRGINSDGNIKISSGNINIESIGVGIKLKGNLYVNGGNVSTKSLTKKGISCEGAIAQTGGTVNAIDKGEGGF